MKTKTYKNDIREFMNSKYASFLSRPLEANFNLFSPLLTVIPLQYIAYELAKLNECSIDKPKNLATKIQNKAMDLESKFLKKRAIQKQKGQEVKNAAKAVSAIPKDIINDAQKTVKKLEKNVD